MSCGDNSPVQFALGCYWSTHKATLRAFSRKTQRITSPPNPLTQYCATPYNNRQNVEDMDDGMYSIPQYGDLKLPALTPSPEAEAAAGCKCRRCWRNKKEEGHSCTTASPKRYDHPLSSPLL